MAIIISLVALIATLYQLYLQRIHNEKSLKPLVQIDLTDRDKLISIHVQNNGIGPFIVQRLTFFKLQMVFYRIQDSLDIDPRTYQHTSVTETVKKVIQPGAFLEVFSLPFEGDRNSKELNDKRDL